MTDRSNFTDEEWHTLVTAPTSAGMMVITASSGGMFRETMAMAKAYAEARQQHGASELLDTIVSQRPQSDHTHYHTPEELREAALQHVREAVALLDQKASPSEAEDYRRFVLSVCKRVAEAHREGGSEGAVSDPEQQAVDAIATALGGAQTAQT